MELGVRDCRGGNGCLRGAWVRHFEGDRCFRRSNVRCWKFCCVRLCNKRREVGEVDEAATFKSDANM